MEVMVMAMMVMGKMLSRHLAGPSDTKMKNIMSGLGADYERIMKRKKLHHHHRHLHTALHRMSSRICSALEEDFSAQDQHHHHHHHHQHHQHHHHCQRQH
eukprot:11245486-Karenia_brevis.AAC.1